MRKFTKTDYRQFLDEIKFLGKQKEFSGTFKDAIKATIQPTQIDAVLENKRIAYNHAYTNVYRKYGITPEDLYKELDNAWDSTAKIISLSEVFNVWHMPKKVDPLTSISMVPGLYLGAILKIVETKWETYKTMSYKIADEHGKEMLTEVEYNEK